MPAAAPIAVLFALPDESGPFRKLVQVETSTGRGVELTVRGTLEGVPVIIAHTGVGAAAAARRASAIIAAERPQAIVSAGFAGGLQASARVGAVIFDPRETSLATPAGCLCGRLVSADAVVETVAAKADLARETGALAVDMETAAIATAAQQAAIPAVALRVISDPADTDLPVPMQVWFDSVRQVPRPFPLVLWLLRHPSRIAPFARFVRGLGPAKTALASALRELVTRGVAPG